METPIMKTPKEKSTKERRKRAKNHKIVDIPKRKNSKQRSRKLMKLMMDSDRFPHRKMIGKGRRTTIHMQLKVNPPKLNNPNRIQPTL